MQARGPYHLIAASIGLLVAAVVLAILIGDLLGDIALPLFYLLTFVAAIVGVTGVIAAGVSIGIRHAQVLTAEAFTLPE